MVASQEDGDAETADAAAQVLVRWRTPASVHLYGQWSHKQYANRLKKALGTDVPCDPDAYTPMCSDEQVVMELEDIAQHLATDANDKTHARQEKRERPVPDSAKAPAPTTFAPSKAIAGDQTPAHTPHSRQRPKSAPNTNTEKAATRCRLTGPHAIPRRELIPGTSPAPPPPKRGGIYELGKLGLVKAVSKDQRGAVERTLRLPNSLWSVSDGGTTHCTVVAYAAKARIGRQYGVYIAVAGDDGLHYPFTYRIIKPYM